MKKRSAGLYILAIVLLISITGCTGNPDDGEIENIQPMLIVNDKNISDEEVNFFLYSSAFNIERYYGYISWDDEIGGIKASEFIKNDAIDAIRLYHSIYKNAYDLGYGLSETQRAELETSKQEYIDYCGGQEGYEKQLASEGITDELYDFFNETSRLYNNIYEARYGENGLNLPTESDLIAFVEEQGYISATHILVSTIDEYGEVYPEEILAEKHQLAEDILERAKAGEDFFMLLEEYGEDPGVADEPHYYNFYPGDMVQEFEEAAFALKDNEISDVVETSYGLHIIKRLPVDFSSLKDVYCNYAFSKTLDEWSKEISFTETDRFKNIDVKEFYDNYLNMLQENSGETPIPPEQP